MTAALLVLALFLAVAALALFDTEPADEDTLRGIAKYERWPA